MVEHAVRLSLTHGKRSRKGERKRSSKPMCTKKANGETILRLPLSNQLKKVERSDSEHDEKERREGEKERRNR